MHLQGKHIWYFLKGAIDKKSAMVFITFIVEGVHAISQTNPHHAHGYVHHWASLIHEMLIKLVCTKLPANKLWEKEKQLYTIYHQASPMIVCVWYPYLINMSVNQACSQYYMLNDFVTILFKETVLFPGADMEHLGAANK